MYVFLLLSWTWMTASYSEPSKFAEAEKRNFGAFKNEEE